MTSRTVGPDGESSGVVPPASAPPGRPRPPTRTARSSSTPSTRTAPTAPAGSPTSTARRSPTSTACSWPARRPTSRPGSTSTTRRKVTGLDLARHQVTVEGAGRRRLGPAGHRHRLRLRRSRRPRLRPRGPVLRQEHPPGHGVGQGHRPRQGGRGRRGVAARAGNGHRPRPPGHRDPPRRPPSLGAGRGRRSRHRRPGRGVVGRDGREDALQHPARGVPRRRQGQGPGGADVGGRAAGRPRRDLHEEDAPQRPRRRGGHRHRLDRRDRRRRARWRRRRRGLGGRRLHRGAPRRLQRAAPGPVRQPRLRPGQGGGHQRRRRQPPLPAGLRAVGHGGRQVDDRRRLLRRDAGQRPRHPLRRWARPRASPGPATTPT